ncbi:MAG: methionine synthase [Anaerolineae bacterium]|nr:methionine synthase [Anaerolineae bacterium]
MQLSKTQSHPASYLETVRQRTVIFDGAMGTNLAAQNLTAAHYGGERYLGCNDHLSLSCPQAVENVHRAFLEAGVDVIETNTFRSNRITLGEYSLAGAVEEINRTAARLARRVADEYSTGSRRRFVAGSIGPSGKLLSLRSGEAEAEALDFDGVATIFRQQAKALIEGGVDLLLLETQQDILEVKAAVYGLQAACEDCGRRLPIQAQVTLDTNGRMLLGTDIRAVLAILQGLEIDVIGLNCSTGPEHMRSALAYLSRACLKPISCLPNAGMPVNREGGAYYPLGAQDFAAQVSGFVRDFGIEVVGGCCGTTPEHLRLLVKALENTRRPARTPVFEPALASAFHAVSLRQEPAPFIIGERLNTQGSRAFKRLMLENDSESAVRIAVEQAENGAHALDLCTALTENEDEGARTQRLAALLSAQVDAPLVIDSTDPAVMEQGLKAAAGRCLLNSVNLESGEEKARRILKLARQHNAAVIALTIDEGGMAKTAAHKLAVARRIYNLAVGEIGLKPQDLIFDPLTFTLASGSPETMDAGLQTLQAIQTIKTELPGVFISLGLSNISFGLNPAARAVLNSVALFHAVKAGLDVAILNPAQIEPYTDIDECERALAEDLLFNRSPQALAEFAAAFDQAAAADQPAALAAQWEALAPAERIRRRILARRKEGLAADLDAYVQASPRTRHESALEIINTILLPAMQEIGEQFGRGELILPFVLQSAEIMRAASDHLERYLEKSRSAAKGRLVLATVYGDVHDIGKNLVKTILSNNGYEVVDLGKQVPVETIVEQAVAQNADAIGLSALLVSTSQQMPLVVAELHKRNLALPVLVGGAAVNPEFARRILHPADGGAYAGGVFYCRDAFDALKVLDGRRNAPADAPQTLQDSETDSPARANGKSTCRTRIERAPIPRAPFIGARVLRALPMDELFASLNRSALFRISWGVRNAKGEKWEQYQRDFTQRLESMWAESQSSGWLQASAVYGYFPCQAQGDDLLVYRSLPKGEEETLRFPLPRQAEAPGLCLSDYFADASSGERDLAAFQFVTLGQAAADHVHQLHAADDITGAFFAHGLAVQLTETAAIYMHRRIRSELGLKANQGKRYSWGYPAIPDLAQHELLFRLLPAGEELGIRLTSAFQFVPEYSTGALIVHHPQAVYFQMQP